MAYISAEETRNIRKELKKSFPKFKFSVRNDGHTAVIVKILAGPTSFGIKEKEVLINQYYLDRYENKEILAGMLDVINTKGGARENFDHSDSQIDYFHVGYYVNLILGSWDKGFQLTA